MYFFGISCQNGGIGGSLDGIWEVTFSGVPIDEPRTYAFIFLILIFASLGGFLMFLTNKLPSENARDNENRVLQITWLKYLRVPYQGVSYLCFTAVIFLSGSLGLAYLGPGIGEMLHYIAYIMMFGCFVMMFILFLKAFDDVIADIKLRNDLALGVDDGKI